MSNHPFNLFIRLLLEASAVITYGFWGFMQSESWTRFLLVICFPLLFALLWGVFAVRNDPSRSGRTVVNTPGGHACSGYAATSTGCLNSEDYRWKIDGDFQTGVMNVRFSTYGTHGAPRLNIQCTTWVPGGAPLNGGYTDPGDAVNDGE